MLWQVKSSLAFGVSAFGTALTLAVTMAGMTIGSLSMGRLLASRRIARPTRLYGCLELAIGAAGIAMPWGFALLESLDGRIYAASASFATPLHALGIALLLGLPTIAMGATIPVFQLVARSHGSRVSILYAMNTGGAAADVLLLSFVLLPALGVLHTALLVASLNALVFVASWLLPEGAALHDGGAEPISAGADGDDTDVAREVRPLSFGTAQMIVFATGFATFGLEVAWFRSLRAAFWSTSGTFAIILASVLIPLAVGARWVPRLRARGVQPGVMLACAGVAILASTPLVQRMDLLILAVAPSTSYFGAMSMWLALSLAIVGPAMLCLGMALPWCLDEFSSPQRSGRLYGLNTLGAVAGSLLSAWLLLPAVGFATTAWFLGLAIMAIACITLERGRGFAVAFGAAALALAVSCSSSPGRDRDYGVPELGEEEILAFHEGPDSTVSVVQHPDGRRLLTIDGFIASSGDPAASIYMDWMGRLPVLLHGDVQDSLVICFGTGRTANAVRREGSKHLDIVDLNASVFEMARFFPANEGVLSDPATQPIVMDGRAWLRRTDRRYDVITLEPMPPNFSGVNALYSREFYQDVAAHLRPGGVTAQWLPLHLVRVAHATAIAATFHSVFPDSILWISPSDGNGILLGRVGPASSPLGSQWPGLARQQERPLGDQAIRLATRLSGATMARYASLGRIITDDNQLLSHNQTRNGYRGTGATRARRENRRLLIRITDPRARGAR